MLELDRDLLGLVGRVLRRLRPRPCGGQRRVVRVFEFATLMADMQQVTVAAVDLLTALRYLNAVRFGILQAVLARLQRPLAPWNNDLQLRRKRLVGVLKAHLIIALAGAAVRNSGGPFLQRALHLVLRDDWPR